MTEIEHRRRVGPTAILAGPCEPDCPACTKAFAERAARAEYSDGVREIVLGMWLEAIAAGERDLPKALEEIKGPLSLLNPIDRHIILGSFVWRSMHTPVKRRRPKPRGRPAAWRKANKQIVDLVNKTEGLPITTAKNDYEKRTAFHRVAEIWCAWGMKSSARQCQDAYWKKLGKGTR